MQAADIAVLVLYFIGITALGVWMAKKVKSMADFVMPRKFGKPMMVMHAFGTGTHSDQAVGVASKTYTNGLSGIWFQWLWLFCTPFYWLIAPVMRRFRALTTADVFEARYDRGVAGLFAGVGLLQYVVNMGTMLVGAAMVIDASTDGAIPVAYAIPAMTAIFVAYGVAGGLGAAIVTDFIQGILTVVFSFLLLPMVMGAVGGMEGIREGVADERMLSLVAPGEIGVFYIVMIAVNALVGIVTQPHTMGNCAAGRTELDGQVGFMGGNFLKRICTIAWCLTGIAAVVYFADKNVEVKPDKVYGMMAGEFLPRLGFGLLGLFLAALVAAMMSSCDSFMIASAGLFTENIYRPLRPGRDEKHYLLVARSASLVVVAGGVAYAFVLSRIDQGVLSGLKTFWKLAAMMGIAFWLGLFWRRTTVAAAWASTLSAFAAMLLSTHGLFVRLAGAVWSGFVFTRDGVAEIYLPWQMVFYLAVGLVVGIVVSLYTQPVDEEKLDRFYALVRTPVKEGEEVPGPCTLPEGVETPPSKPVFPNTKLEVQIPRARSFIGFGVGWVLVAATIAVFVWIAKG